MYKKVYVEITNQCNMNCSFCHGHNRIPRQMSLDEFTYILGKLTGHTQYIYYHLMGEPLTHPLLPAFLKIANECGYRSIITTNGTLLHKRKNELLDSGLHKVNISLHSFESDNDKAHYVYLTDLSDFAKSAADKGTIVVFRLWNKGFDNGKNKDALKILKSKIPGVWTENTRGIKVRDKIFIEFGKRFEWPDSNADIKGDKFFCYGLKDQFGVLVDGTVVPCCLDSEGSIELGNIFTQEIDTILSCERAINLVEGFKCGRASEDLCKRCGYSQRFV